MAKVIVTVLLFGSSKDNLRPHGFTAFQETWTGSSELFQESNRLDEQGYWFEYRDHIMNVSNLSEVENQLKDIYGEYISNYPYKKTN